MSNYKIKASSSGKASQLQELKAYMQFKDKAIVVRAPLEVKYTTNSNTKLIQCSCLHGYGLICPMCGHYTPYPKLMRSNTKM